MTTTNKNNRNAAAATVKSTTDGFEQDVYLPYVIQCALEFRREAGELRFDLRIRLATLFVGTA